MIKIITANLNGIRSANRKGFFEWMLGQSADFVCLQEVKAQAEDIPSELIEIDEYTSFFHFAKKKGYSGTAIYTKHKPLNVTLGLNHAEMDNDGRCVRLDYEKFSIISLYLPSGSAGPDSQAKKFRALNYYFPILQQQIKEQQSFGRALIICGDFNIAHNNIDLKNWKNNQKNSGFLPEERQWMTDVLDLGFVDIWRNLYPEIPGYTWWSQRNLGAYANDIGWRIDYQLATSSFANAAKSAVVFKEIKFSDHAPLIVEYDTI